MGQALNPTQRLVTPMPFMLILHQWACLDKEVFVTTFWVHLWIKLMVILPW